MDRDRLAVVAALVVPIVAAALLALRRDSFANTNAALVLVLVIVAVGANGDRLAGVLAALSAGLSFDFFLTKPYGHFAITERADAETTILLLAVGHRRDRARPLGPPQARAGQSRGGLSRGDPVRRRAGLRRGVEPVH